LAIGTFITHPDEKLLVVGSSIEMKLVPRSNKGGYVTIYRITNDFKFELIQKTLIEDVPQSVCPFQGKLLIGMGKTLRLYELGKKKLLRKCETKAFPFSIVKIETQGDRIYVSDSQESVHYCLFRHYDNQIVIFADDFISRWMTCATMLDYDTVAGGDKFGNIFIMRLDPATSKTMDEDTTGSLAVYERGYLNGAPNRIAHQVDFHIGDTVTSIQKTSIVPGDRQIVVYTTIMGSIGTLSPFVAKDDIEFMTLLEMMMRMHAPPICGNNHLTYRGTYVPVSRCIDGDLCETFNSLPNETKRIVSAGLDRNTGEVAKS
jgi:splicing factor 3B subunit 3